MAPRPRCWWDDGKRGRDGEGRAARAAQQPDGSTGRWERAGAGMGRETAACITTTRHDDYVDYVVGSHRKREDNSMMIFMDRTGQEDEERTFAVMMDDIRWDEDQDETTMEPS